MNLSILPLGAVFPGEVVSDSSGILYIIGLIFIVIGIFRIIRRRSFYD